MMAYTVSGCIVTYNNADKIEKTVSSLLENTKGVNLHLYIVDNCSSDGTAQLVEEKFPSVKVIRAEKNAGFGAGHNLVIPYLDSDFHAVINPDIVIEDDVLTALCETAQKYPGAGLLSPKIINPDGSEQLLGKKIPSFKYLAAHRLYKPGQEPGRLMKEYCMTDGGDEPFEIKNATGCFMFFRTAEFKRLGGFDERFFMYLEDCDIARRANTALFVPGVQVKHMWERASKTNKKLLMVHVQSIIKYHLKWLFR
ncbi:MAG: glycosyltransferase family 2 protein [Clostridia bacterium]|nr:glycosyltransferase family 2 protein [Clostridia bacterium]